MIFGKVTMDNSVWRRLKNVLLSLNTGKKNSWKRPVDFFKVWLSNLRKTAYICSRKNSLLWIAATYSIVFKGHFVQHYRIYNLGLSVGNMKIKFEWIIVILSLFWFLLCGIRGSALLNFRLPHNGLAMILTILR